MKKLLSEANWGAGNRSEERGLGEIRHLMDQKRIDGLHGAI